LPKKTFANTHLLRFTDKQEREAFAHQIELQKSTQKHHPLYINNQEIQTETKIESYNPAHSEQLVGSTASATRKHVDSAIEAALEGLEHWQDLGFAGRANLLLKAAASLESSRMEFAALEVLEAGKTWVEADADVAEAIDFLRFYAQLGAKYEEGYHQHTPGETNSTTYRGRGIAAIIPPWNFPLAILTGMTTAALVSGNCCLLKPASATPLVGARFVQLMIEQGIPPGVLNFLPGPGDEVGAYMVEHPEVKVIAFTGSRQVGLGIMRSVSEQSASQSYLKSVIAEMGGKNAIIVDDDADLDEAVTAILHSAFGFQGQKCSACSRVIAVGAVHDKLVELLVDAAASLRPGDPQNPGSEIGPVIDARSKSRISSEIESARSYCTLAWRGKKYELGHYVPPTIFSGVDPESELAQEEIFGPVLAVIKADDFMHAIEIANNIKYALTGGVYSRHPDHLEWAKKYLQVGNLYLNRAITGALVGRQPFGGFKQSGTGPKAGGEDYLLPFMQAHTVTENTLRKGAAPKPLSDS
jgi:RHH-type proline utilization regulon transcriptional repressor/proline dehydrogenase/delta 1-pyrroline-5-carboxylate dehydrogenase